MVAQSSSVCQPKEIWAFCAHCSADSVPPGEDPSSPWLGCGGEDCAVHPVSLETPPACQSSKFDFVRINPVWVAGCRLSQLAILAILSTKGVPFVEEAQPPIRPFKLRQPCGGRKETHTALAGWVSSQLVIGKRGCMPFSKIPLGFSPACKKQFLLHRSVASCTRSRPILLQHALCSRKQISAWGILLVICHMLLQYSSSLLCTSLVIGASRARNLG